MSDWVIDLPGTSSSTPLIYELPISQYLIIMKKAFSISRIFDTTTEQMYNTQTRVHHLKEWWAPTGFDLTVCSIDLRPGGIFHYCMQAHDGYEMWGRFVFHKIIPYDQLTYSASFSNRYKGITRNPLSETWPMETLNNITFNDIEQGVELTLTATAINCSEIEEETFIKNFENIRQGYSGTLDQLAVYLEKINR